MKGRIYITTSRGFLGPCGPVPPVESRRVERSRCSDSDTSPEAVHGNVRSLEQLLDEAGRLRLTGSAGCMNRAGDGNRNKRVPWLLPLPFVAGAEPDVKQGVMEVV